MTQQYKEIMLDLETLGKGPEAAVVSIGAVKFNLEDYDNYEDIRNRPERTFKATISLENIEGKIDGSTVNWWLKQSEEARRSLTEADTHFPSTAIQNFSRWVWPERMYNIWGNGATFDNIILRSLFYKLRQPKPWAYNQDRDMRTLKDIALRVCPDLDLNIRIGTYHNALDDAITQVLLVQRMYRAITGKLDESERKRRELSSPS
jgi:hypothetical protein